MSVKKNNRSPASLPLHRPEFEHDSCGFGLFAHVEGKASHWLVQMAARSLCRLTHRGAIAADGKTGDGCGLLMSQPEEFLRAVAEEEGLHLERRFAAGMVFLPTAAPAAEQARRCLAACLREQGLETAGWRQVPTNPGVCGAEALQNLPRFEQIFVNLPANGDADEQERALYTARRQAERLLAKEDFYVCGLSSRLLGYKGLVTPEQLSAFYPDLRDERMASAMCVFHQRFSTNTLPRWRLAQPFRYLAHNGEINTIQGNRSWAQARRNKFRHSRFPQPEALLPIVSGRDSDSCSVDNMLEFLLMGGLDLCHATRLLIPPAWQNAERMNPKLRAYYRYNSMRMEPWDGPAGIVMTNGRIGACIMDRNGLRPARYTVTRDGYVTVGSEFGIRDCDADTVTAKGRLRPGEMIAVDIEAGELLLPEDIDARLQARNPCREWLRRGAPRLPAARGEQPLADAPMLPEELLTHQKLFLLTREECEQTLRVLAENGQEPVASMGDDTPFPVLSRHIRSLYDSFRQRFAQVTNPAIDPIREQVVMSLATRLGPEPDLFREAPEDAAQRLELPSPVLSEREFRLLAGQREGGPTGERIELNYRPRERRLGEAIEAVCERAVAAVRNGKPLLLLSDRAIGPETLPIHALLAVGAVHHRLNREGLRCDASIVVESATARDPHHFAVLIAAGATAVYPYLAYETLHDMHRRGVFAGSSGAEVGRSYRTGIEKGLYKVLSKMGISTIASYRGAQLFEVVGLHDEVVSLCFCGAVSRLQGMRLKHLESDQRLLAEEAWNVRKPLRQGGLLKFVYGGEFHAFNPDVVTLLHAAVESGDYERYREFSDAVNRRQITVFRDLLRLRPDTQPVPLEEVAPVEDIVVRFDTAGMSLGALSPTAHEALAQAMNALGGRSNSGEGGEARHRYGSDRNSKIKQVASGRFGVTPHYLVNAEVLQIKIAQGAKPGEGGQLPGHKVNEMIAELRHSKPGVSLISPPPHHDIYSIEDLAQLIFDLKQINPEAMVSVKLVAEAGVGTVAVGVAKAYADLITISGYDGGTGASPLTSIKYAGGPWELGLRETHQILRASDLRDRVRIQVDGGLKTGLDVVKAAILGAESFGFGTAPMVALGCKYLRICHLNNCATGVATQNKVLYTEHFKPDGAQKVMNYFRFVAREVRELMAQLGMRRLEDLIGRTDLLEVLPGDTERQAGLDLSPIVEDGGGSQPHYCRRPSNPPYDKGELAERMVADALPAIADRRGGEFYYRICNWHRSIGARLSGEIARRHGNRGLAGQPLRIRFQGSAGQSFGVWNAGGLELRLEGEANDYVGKGMAGGRLTIYPPRQSRFRSEESVIMGNACLYGATGGRLLAAGVAGERFAVRNSGATAVVEGVGDHGCEYMTGGVVAVLGATGINFGAGMTGGLAFVLDRHDLFGDRCNRDSVEMHRIDAALERYGDFLLRLVEEHARETGSRWGARIRDEFADWRGRCWLVHPKGAELSSLLAYLRAAA